MDAELATQAAAGQIADLRGQLEEALTDADTARKRLTELEAATEVTSGSKTTGTSPPPSLSPPRRRWMVRSRTLPLRSWTRSAELMRPSGAGVRQGGVGGQGEGRRGR